MSTRKEKHTLASNEKHLAQQINGFFTDFCTEYDLRNPSAKLAQEFYKTFLNEFYIDASDVMQIQGSQMSILDYSEMYTDSIPLINLVAAVKMLNIPGLDGLCVFDLINPTPKRTFQYFSIAMSYLRYCDVKVAELEIKFEEIEKKCKDKQMLQESINSMKESLNNQAKERVLFTSKISDRSHEMEQLMHEQILLKKDIDILEKQFSNIQLHYHEKVKVWEINQKSFKTIENDVKEFKQQVKEVTQKIKHAQVDIGPTCSIELLSAKAKEVVEDYKAVMDRLRENEKRLEQQQTYHKLHMSRLESLRNITEIINKAQNYKTEMNDVLREIKEFEEKMRESKIPLLSINKKIVQLKEKISSLQQEHKEQLISLTKEQSIAKKECDHYSGIETEKQARSDRVANEINTYITKLQENEMVSSGILELVTRKYEENALKIKKMEADAKSFIDQFFNSN